MLQYNAIIPLKFWWQWYFWPPFLLVFFTFFLTFLCSVLSTLFHLTSVEHYVNIGCCLLGSEGLKVLLYSKEPDHATYVLNCASTHFSCNCWLLWKGSRVKKTVNNWQICLKSEESLKTKFPMCEKLPHHFHSTLISDDLSPNILKFGDVMIHFLMSKIYLFLTVSLKGTYL